LEGLTDEIKDGKIKEEHFFEVLSLIGEKSYGNGVDFHEAVKEICKSFTYFYLYEEVK